MILYHGSNVAIDRIDLAKCRPFKDFGQGFYLTSLLDQAAQMAARTTKINGFGSPTVTAFELEDDWANLPLRMRIFDSPSREWALFVVNNRDRGFTDLSSPECNRLNQYDMVYGPVADDAIVASFQLFQDGYIGIDELVRRFEYRKLNDQYSFHTLDAIRHLRRVGVTEGQL